MNVYLFLFFVIWIISFISIIANKEKIGYLILTITITILTMFRFDTGWDYYWYWFVGDKTNLNNWFFEQAYTKIEFGHRVIYDITRYFENPQIYFMITGLLSSIFLFIGIYKQSRYPLLSLSIYATTIYFYPYSLGFIRQYLALSMVLYNNINLMENKKIKYILNTLIISFLFHYSALLSLIFLVIKKLKLKLLLIFVFFIPLYREIMGIVLNKLYPKYLYYLNKEIKSPLSTQIIIYLILGLILVILEIKFKREESLYKKYFWLGILIYIILNELIGGHIGFRIGIYMMIFKVIYIPTILDNFKNKKIIQILTLTLVILLGQISMIRAIRTEEFYEVGNRRNFNFKLNFKLNKSDEKFEAKVLP